MSRRFCDIAKATISTRNLPRVRCASHCAFSPRLAVFPSNAWKRDLKQPPDAPNPALCTSLFQPTSVRRQYTQVTEPSGEPGIDVSALEKSNNSPNDEHQSDITVVDFSSERIEEHDLSGQPVGPFMKQNPKQDWAACRWIFVNGLDPGVIHELAECLHLHKLAIEDVLDTDSRTKVDWYRGHLCAILTLQKLVQGKDQSEHTPMSSTSTVLPKQSWQERYQNKPAPIHHRFSKHLLASRHSPSVRIEQVSIFLTSDGTVVTLFETMGKEVLKPVMARLQASGTILRSSDDASMIVHAVLDAIIDLSLPIAGAYHQAIRDLELDVLTNPKLSQPRDLYALRSDLALLDSVIKPIDGLVNTLRDHQYVAFLSNNPRAMHHHGSVPTAHTGNKDDNLISSLAQAYLADVHDHVLVVSTSLAGSIGSVENLTSLIFNTISAKQNESIRQLTVVTIFFLPLTFLTGYFGMNFDPFPAVNNHSDLFFWFMAMPVMFVTLFTLIRGSSARRFAERMQHRLRGPRPADKK